MVMAVLAAGCGGEASIESATTEPTRAEADPAPASTNNVSPEDVDISAEGGVAADSASTVAPVRSRGQQSTSEQSQRYSSIRDVDFLNGFTYDPGAGFEGAASMATVQDGSFENGEHGAEEYYWFGVTDVEIGDLDRDGVEDALVATSWNGGGTGYFDSVTAYRLVDGQAISAGRVHFGDRADGGIYDVRIVDGAAQVWSFSTTLGACCPSEITQNNLVLGEHFLVQTERGTTRTWIAPGSGNENEELKFLPGTSSAVIAVYGNETEVAFTFDAAQGQLLTLDLVDGPAPAVISVTDLATGQIMSGLAAMTLPSDSLYEVSIEFDAARNDTTTIDVIIGAEPSLPVSWTSAVEQLVVTDEPYVTTSLIWPVFASDQAGTDAANEELASFVSALDDYWVEDVTQFSDPLDDSSFDVRYEVTLASTEIVSVRFNFYDYVCCRPYPNYGPRAAVLDLTAGRLLTVDQIVDTNRLDQVTALWIAELEKQELLPDSAEALLAQNPRFDSLALTPEGVEFGTERNSLGGGFPGTSTVVAYEQLGELVNPTLVARVAAG